MRSRSFGLPVLLVTPEFPRRLARELHDTVGHSLTAISLHARAAGRAQPHPQLALVDELAQQTIRRLGNIVYALRTGTPAAEDEPVGLTDAVQRAVRELQGLSPPIRCRLTGPDVRPPAGVLRLVRQVVTEALINGLKNGPLREAHVQLRVDDEIEVRVLTYRGEPADEGPGLVGLGLGLRGLAEEAHNYGGLLSCHQSLGGRFCVSARIPLFWNGTAPTARPGGGTGVERTEVLA